MSSHEAAVTAALQLTTQQRPADAEGEPTSMTEQFDLGYRYAMREVRWAIEDTLKDASE